MAPKNLPPSVRWRAERGLSIPAFLDMIRAIDPRHEGIGNRTLRRIERTPHNAHAWHLVLVSAATDGEISIEQLLTAEARKVLKRARNRFAKRVG